MLRIRIRFYLTRSQLRWGVRRLQRSMPRTLLVIAVLGALTGCHSAPPSARYIPPEQRPVPNAARIHELISALSALDGAFSDPNIYYTLVTDFRPIAELASADTAAIRPLVACLRNLHRARVRYVGKRVAVGMVCAYVLVETKYVQRHLQYSCFPSDWKGVVSPTLDDKELLAAWAAWQDWLGDHSLAQSSSSESPNDRCT